MVPNVPTSQRPQTGLRPPDVRLCPCRFYCAERAGGIGFRFALGLERTTVPDSSVMDLFTAFGCGRSGAMARHTQLPLISRWAGLSENSGGAIFVGGQGSFA